VKYPLSVLDVSPVASGSSSRDALLHTIDLAQLVDQLGYTRHWLAEHHNTSGIASSVPEVMIGHVAQATKRIRVGSGGIMLPNHAPLKVAETFRLLEALHPGRIDLGLGRAPGTDPLTAFALRRSKEAMRADDFPEQLGELMAFLADDFPIDHPFRNIHAVPQGVKSPDLWLLGSSDFSARVAAKLGLSFAFAHHIAPAEAVRAMRLYREAFEPSVSLREPRTILALSVICANTDEEAEALASSVRLRFLRMEQGDRGPIPSVAEARAYPYTTTDLRRLDAARPRHQIGSARSVKKRLEELALETGATEIMALTIVHDHAARRRSYELLMENGPEMPAWPIDAPDRQGQAAAAPSTSSSPELG
jgi:luciferase family oxidoreductase group 1